MNYNPINQDTIMKHKKGGEYYFLGVVVASSEKPNKEPFTTQKVFHTELQKEITMYNYMVGSSVVCFSEVDEYLVLYQDVKDLDAEHLYARPIQMFFEHVKEPTGELVRRFEVKKRG